ncbi:MAG TPA: 1-deoxy-D-xylulose-5-phosphate reductoisomerase [Candidatus Hydrogenedentes bacterium]|nr:1-deoxy-D-xylulose-5-phosphate reductoisomerase [Candidatus Hydrogenedentota bacterium]HOL77516.1 1-deoxy-D-xylulose-5-phosphate reductoisomerase [Candidatus Hydrogenedentota bacterium]HPO86605.1 1-deoxy-D-xylulose-5-phosphate reductoisomerase [Candidatus Hydrogenedentota bacterium]
MRKRVTILGSTGSIGRNALDVVRRHADQFEVVGLAAFSNVKLLAEQIQEFRPRLAAIGDERQARALQVHGSDTRIVSGPSGIEEIAAMSADVALCAIVGAAGLQPILRIIESGGRLALANKEPMVMAGALITERAKTSGAEIIPVDSEHSAIWQCLHGNDRRNVYRIYLTASGGPFYGKSREQLESVTPEQAARHPTWDMGKKISVDSATLMNKGLEVIEAMWLFDLPPDRIQVIIHPQSVVHGLVEFTDGSILAHLGPTDMRFPIEYALSWPERASSALGRLDLTVLKQLTFAPPDFGNFPCLQFALEAARRGGTAPTILNAANEVAVSAFCHHQIPFLAISEVVRFALDTCPVSDQVTLANVLESDRLAREVAQRKIKELGV